MELNLIRRASLFVFLGVLISCIYAKNGSSRPSARGPTSSGRRNFYDFKVKTVKGVDMELDEYRGQVLLVVNVASQCGFTDGHYKALARLHNVLSRTGRFSVLAFPCNQFGNQEPDTDVEIYDFVTKTYQVSFPMFRKSNVIEPHTNPVYRYLAEVSGKEPNWNFWKYLIDHQGNVVGSYGPWTDVEEITDLIRTCVNNAVKADPNPNQEASGPLQQAHADYGDGAGGGLDIWSEAMPSAKPVDEDSDSSNGNSRRAGTNPDMTPDDLNPPGIPDTPKAPEGLPQGPAVAFRPMEHPPVVTKPSMPTSRHDDL